jgi:hypothetical protein
MHLISKFGDIVVLFASGGRSGGVAIYLRRATGCPLLFAALIGCVGAALFAKLAFAACGVDCSRVGIESPSGHAALSTAFYGCLALLVGAGRSTGYVWRFILWRGH